LDGTELATAESQERMAVTCSPQDMEELLAIAKEENVEATVI
jgi:phosphoribosylformylglycinamidine synthase